MKARMLVGALAVTLPAIGVGGTALGDDHGRFRRVPISFSAGVETGPPKLLATICTPTDEADPTDVPECVYAAEIEPGNTVVGDLAGDFVEAFGATDPTADGLSFVAGVGAFEGEVKRCGRGAFFYTSVLTADAEYFQITIMPGSGTGDLAGITGSFRQESGTPSVDGWVRCRVGRR